MEADEDGEPPGIGHIRLSRTVFMKDFGVGKG
jgi:hypothetical protein